MLPTDPLFPPDNLRPQEEIVALHDFLGRIVNDEVQLPLDEDQMDFLSSVLGVLCWALQHPAGDELDDLIVELKALMDEAGYNGKRPPDVGLKNSPWN